jgi:hypothetical protein
MVTFQPFYIAGIEDVDQAKASAYGACGMFLVTMCLSVAGIFYDNNFKKEDPSSMEDAAEGYQLQTGDVPTYGAAE